VLSATCALLCCTFIVPKKSRPQLKLKILNLCFVCCVTVICACAHACVYLLPYCAFTYIYVPHVLCMAWVISGIREKWCVWVRNELKFNQDKAEASRMSKEKTNELNSSRAFRGSFGHARCISSENEPEAHVCVCVCV